MVERMTFSMLSRRFSSSMPSLVGLCLLFLTLAAGCMPFKQARVASVALTLQDVSQAAAKQRDPFIVREGTPGYLMLLDGLLEAYPDNKELLLAASQANASYASGFLADEDQRKAGRLYLKAKMYGFRALSDRGDFAEAASGNIDEFKALLKRYGPKDVPALFWTANAWASWISTNLSSVEAVGDLPALEATMQRVLELNGDYYYGGPHLLMGVYLAAKPPVLGGDLNRARIHFDRALALSGGKVLGARVLFAEYYARNAQEKELYVKTLEEVLAAAPGEVPELTLANVMAQEKARRLLDRTEEYFENAVP